MNEFLIKISAPLLGVVGVMLGLLAGRREAIAKAERQRLENIQKIINLYKESFDDMQTKLSTLSDEIDELRTENIALKNEMAESRQENASLKKELHNLTDQLKQYQGK